MKENKRELITCSFALSFPKSASAVPDCETTAALVETNMKKDLEREMNKFTDIFNYIIGIILFEVKSKLIISGKNNKNAFSDKKLNNVWAKQSLKPLTALHTEIIDPQQNDCKNGGCL